MKRCNVHIRPHPFSPIIGFLSEHCICSVLEAVDRWNATVRNCHNEWFTSLFVLTFPEPFQSLCHGLRCQQRCQPVQCQTWGQMIRSGHLGRFTWPCIASWLRGFSNCTLVIQTNRANALGWRELRLRKFTIWCLHDWSCWFEPPRYLLLSPRCSAVGLLSCASVRLAHVVLKLIALNALIVEEKCCLQKLSAAEMFPFYGHILYLHRDTDNMITCTS